MPDFSVIDTHVHLYDPARLAYGWMKDTPEINHPHLKGEYDAAVRPARIDAFVFVEVAVDPGLHLAEAQFAADLGESEPRMAAIVAHAPVESGAAVEPHLEKLMQHKRLRGIRRLIQGEANPAICIEPAFVAGVRTLARYGLSFDLCVKHWAMVYAIELVKACPDVMFILDHIGKPDIRNRLREPWWSQIREMARLPNLVCKISGAIGEADPQHWNKAQVMPYVAHAIHCFGFERCMFGSDWPVSRLTNTYSQWVELVDEVIAGATDAEKRALYCNTAQRVYRLDSIRAAS